MREHDIERELDAALAKYAAVEPRDGFEQRVLANLRAQDTRATRFAWRRLAAAGFVLAAVAVLAVVVGERHPAMVNVKPLAIHRETPIAGDFASNAGAATELNAGETQRGSERTPRKSTRRRDREVVEANVELAPKLTQFPAPEPMTEQEKLLVQFVEQDPRDAVLVARETTERLRRETEEIEGRKTDTSGEQEEQ